MFFVYIITNKKNGTLYLGQTDNLSKRMWEHKNKSYKGFASKYNLTKLVWFDIFDSREYAFSNERRLKAWKRAWKINLIEEINPDWKDLSFEL